VPDLRRKSLDEVRVVQASSSSSGTLRC
jgi:hypothetical protein